MADKSLDLNKLGISLSENTSSADVKKVVKKIAAVNNEVVNIIEADEASIERIKEIKAEMKEKNRKLLEELKQLKSEKKVRTEKKLLLLGERIAYVKDLKQLGVSMEKKNLSLITKNAASQRVLVEAELES